MCVERPVLQDGAYLVDGVGDDRVWMWVMIRLGEDPFRWTPPTFGHCPNSDWTPPRTQPGTLGHFFSGHFYHSAGLYASEDGKCPKPSASV